MASSSSAELAGSAAAPSGAAVQAVPRVRRAPGQPRWIGLAFVAPAVVLYLLFAFGPLLYTAYLSLYQWDGLSPGVYTGLDNYSDVLSDPDIRSSFVHALVLIGFYAVLPVLLGLLLSSVLSHGRMRGVAAFRTIFVLPQTIATVVVASAWVYMYGPQGPVNQLLDLVGLDSISRSWLGDFRYALPALGLVGAWVMFGLCTILFLTGIQKIPLSLYEAARVDGAGRWREFTAVTLPHLRGELSVALTITIIFALRSFDLIYVSTAGGPGTSTTVPSFLVYQNAFGNGQVGLAAAIAVVLTVIIFVVVAVITKLVDRDVRA
jgi:raffinose/stachyose/melibiose transport system permease protein